MKKLVLLAGLILAACVGLPAVASTSVTTLEKQYSTAAPVSMLVDANTAIGIENCTPSPAQAENLLTTYDTHAAPATGPDMPSAMPGGASLCVPSTSILSLYT